MIITISNEFRKGAFMRNENKNSSLRNSSFSLHCLNVAFTNRILFSYENQAILYTTKILQLKMFVE